jgi:hypothetical protein
VRFPNLFRKSSETDITLAQAYSEEGWWIPFRRNLDQEDIQAWGELSSLVEDIELEDREDVSLGIGSNLEAILLDPCTRSV